MDLQIKGKVALITGGSKGIGAGCAEALAREGVDIVALHRSDDEGSQAFVNKLATDYGVRAMAIRADVTDPAQVEAAYDKAIAQMGQIDILVNNACSFYPPAEFDEMDFDNWTSQINGSLNHVFTVSRRFVAECKQAKRGGHIVNVLAKAAITSNSKRNTAYIAGKGGMTTLTRGMANELIDYDIVVNGIVPGYVRTHGAYLPGSPEEKAKEGFLRVGWAQPIDMGVVAAFLCSPVANQVVGAIVDCSGGTML